MNMRHVRPALPDFRWTGVEVRDYKAGGEGPFRDVTRQVLFAGDTPGCELRYFEVAAGGWTTLERHRHAHAVVIARGRGRCLVDGAIAAVGVHDLVHVPPLAWHQFRADGDAPLGFFCMVDATRDRPQLPSDEDLRALRAIAGVAEFLAS